MSENENEKIVTGVVMVFMVIFIGVALLWRYSDKDQSENEKQNDLNSYNEIEIINRGESYYKQKGYQVFPQFNLAIKTPITLKDISYQSSNDFDLEYGAIDNQNDPLKMAVYQLMIIRLPVSYKVANYKEKEQVKKSILNKLTQDISGRYVKFSHEELDAYVANSTFNGYSSKCIYFFREDYVFCLVIISNDSLNERFNRLTNNIHFYDNDTSNKNISHQSYKVFKSSIYDGLSIKYPKNYEIVAQPNQKVIAAFISPEDGDTFRSNFNIVVSNTSKSIDDAALFSIRDMQLYFDDFEIVSKGYSTINNTNYYLIIANYTLANYSVKAIQYATKKNGILYIITFTVAQDEYYKEKTTINSIINSFKLN